MFVPTIGIGGEFKFNRRFGIALHMSMPIKRTQNKTVNNVEHKMKVGMTDIRLIGTYSIRNS